jgi:hypothetical protein
MQINNQILADVVAELCRASTELSVLELLVNAAPKLGFSDSRVYLSIDCPIQKSRFHTLVAQHASTVTPVSPGYRIAFATLQHGQSWSAERGEQASKDPKKAIWVKELGLEDQEWIDISIQSKDNIVGLWSLSAKVGSKEHSAIKEWVLRIDILTTLGMLAANQVLNIKKPSLSDSIQAKDLEKTFEGGSAEYVKNEILAVINRSLDAQFIAYFEYDSERHSLVKVAEIINGEPLTSEVEVDVEYSLKSADAHNSLTASAFNDQSLEFIPFFESVKTQ